MARGRFHFGVAVLLALTGTSGFAAASTLDAETAIAAPRLPPLQVSTWQRPDALSTLQWRTTATHGDSHAGADEHSSGALAAFHDFGWSRSDGNQDHHGGTHFDGDHHEQHRWHDGRLDDADHWRQCASGPPAPVPLPASFWLLASGAAAFAPQWLRNRRARRSSLDRKVSFAVESEP